MTIGITDDHVPFLQSLASLIDSFSDMQVVLKAINGNDLLEKLSTSELIPQVCLIDVNMPGMSSSAIIDKLNKYHPDVKSIVISMDTDDRYIIKMIHAGCRSWWLKYQAAEDLERIIRGVIRDGYYNSDSVNVTYRRQINFKETRPVLTSIDMDILQLLATDVVDDDIEARMGIERNSLLGMIDHLYGKLHVQSRMGACLEALRLGFIHP